MVTLYSPDNPHKAYKEEVWWSDRWDPLSYGQEYDFKKPFFEQFHALRLAVPRRGMQQDGTNENAEYTTYGGSNKNCYLTFASFGCEDVYMSCWVLMSRNCMDSFLCFQSELLYDCVDCKNCYNCVSCHNCINCQDSFFLEDCHNCNHCIGCKNLRNKEYYLWNKPVTKEEFETAKTQLRSAKAFREWKEKFDEWRVTLPTCYAHFIEAENCSGNVIEHAHNCHNCFDLLLGAQDCRHCQFCGWKGKDMMDCSMSGKESELLYEMHATINAQRSAFTTFCKMSEKVYYCDSISNCTNCFGCIGLKHKQYCILNKQYTQEEYEELLPRIIEHMRSTGEWGENMPVAFSPFAYNETLSQEHFPLSKEEVLERGWRWKEPDEKQKGEQTAQAQDTIDDVEDSLVQQVLACRTCSRHFKIIPQKLAFYRRMGVPVDARCWECRQRGRMALRTPHKLWDRQCMKCGKDLQSAYAPERPEIVYCEECYLAEVY